MALNEMTTRIEQIKKRAEKATTGPWSIDPRHHSQNQSIRRQEADVHVDGGRLISSVRITVWRQGQRDARPDAAFIAHARNDVPWLLERMGEAADVIKKCRTELAYLAEQVKSRKGGSVDTALQASNAFLATLEESESADV